MLLKYGGTTKLAIPRVEGELLGKEDKLVNGVS